MLKRISSWFIYQIIQKVNFVVNFFRWKRYNHLWSVIRFLNARNAKISLKSQLNLAFCWVFFLTKFCEWFNKMEMDAKFQWKTWKHSRWKRKGAAVSDCYDLLTKIEEKRTENRIITIRKISIHFLQIYLLLLSTLLPHDCQHTHHDKGIQMFAPRYHKKLQQW